MNTPIDDGSRSRWQRIDETCDRFENEKRQGKDPLIFEFLQDAASPDEREFLLRELIALDMDLASASGATINVEHYLKQLPEDEQLIRSSFERSQSRNRSNVSVDVGEPRLRPG